MGRAIPRPPRISFVCDRCDRAIHQVLDASLESIACPGCGRGHDVRVEPAALASRLLRRCLRCGLERLYVQKDFNRKVGLGVFVAAAILSVPTWGLSLLAATLVDMTLYVVLGDVALCYGCRTQHRGFQRNPAHGPFDLHVAESVERRRTA
jgi:hypothetical protein